VIIKATTALPFVSIPIIGKIELNTKDDLSEQCKTPVEIIYTDKEVLTEVLYRYTYAVAL